ncbi:EKC/KEOPS complex subunit Cgi121p [[Candida] anglica]|uniref:EKC/KEOPS complex subunit CGI121 n=1 Tax=[Candida] anglica TaxID=148631 RepID=A0ABP0EA46_9ASCO
MYTTIAFPQFPEQTAFISYFSNVPKDVLSEVKAQLIAANTEYDFCFLNTKHIISLEHLQSSIYRAVSNHTYASMKAKTLNTEIIFSLSPVNNIMDALKRFGVDQDCSNLVAIKIVPTKENVDFEEIHKHLIKILPGAKPESLSDDVLYTTVDIPKFKKLYKLNDAVLSNDPKGIQTELTRLAVSTCQLRGL